MMKILFLISLIALSSCKNSLKDLHDAHQWINDPGQGLIKTKTVGDIKLTVKYLPPNYLAHKEAVDIGIVSPSTVDSLYRDYQNSDAFLLTIASVVDEDSNDPMYKNLEDFPQY